MPSSQQPPSEAQIYRLAIVDRTGVDREARSFPITLTTETPVRVFDMARMEVVDEILHGDGAQLPKQIPLVDTHDRSTVGNTLGSIRDLKVVNGSVVGRAYFGRSERSQQAFDDYADGHLTDFSVGARHIDGGIEYAGQTKHVRAWKPFEGSAVLVGADPNAKALLAQRAYLNPEQVKEEVMFAQVRELMLKRGLKSDATDAEVVEFIQRLAQPEEGKTATTDQQDLAELVRNLKVAVTATPAPATGSTTVTPDPTEAVRAERKRVGDIEDIARQHAAHVSAEDKKKWIDDGASVDAISREVLSRRAAAGTPTAGRVEVTTSEREKFYTSARSAFVTRAVSAAGLSPSSVSANALRLGDHAAIKRAEYLKADFENPLPGSERFRFTGLSDLARMFLEQAGEYHEGMSKWDIAERACRMEKFVSLRSVEGPAYHTTGSFPQLMLDAANKTLLAAYDEADASYTQWVRTAASAPDFKTLNRIRFGELPDLKLVGENKEYEESTTSDAKVSYGVEKYGQIFSITMEAIVNDDMDALARIPAMQGTAARRKVNKACYAVLTGNTFPDGSTTIFSTANANGANNAITVDNLSTAFSAMGTKAGLTSGTILNLKPKFLVVPFALSGVALQLVNSMAVPTAGGSAAGNSNTANIYGPGGPRQLVVVTEGQLDGASTAIWYLLADNRQIDTVEITFLQGEESPVLQQEEAFKRDAVLYKIRQTFKAAAIDYRGMYRGGAGVS